MTTIDIIVPVATDTKNIDSIIVEISRAFSEKNASFQIHLIVDNKLPNLLTQSKKLTKKHNLSVWIKTLNHSWQDEIVSLASYSTKNYCLLLSPHEAYSLTNLSEILQKIESNGVVLANRLVEKNGKLKNHTSKLSRFFSSKLSFGISHDIHTGLILFNREVAQNLTSQEHRNENLNHLIVNTALELGLTIDSVDVRKLDNSKKSSLFPWKNKTLSFPFKGSNVYPIASTDGGVIGSGLVYHRQRFITHSKLPHQHSALITFSPWQKSVFFLAALATIVGGFINLQITATIFIGVLSTVYFIDVLFTLYVVLKSLHFPPELNFSDEEINSLKDSELPVYTILCPLYREVHVLPQFIKAMDELSWPKEKLEVLLLLEENDVETVETARGMDLPKNFKIIVVPHSQPKTKPKACNYGLQVATGEFVVIYDAEDIPEPKQLKKAYLAFGKSSTKTVCLQAKLNYYNPHHNLLTRLFTAEYSLWFDVVLPGLQSIDTTIPLGGTSNHFRTTALITLGGWDPFNVTEDCDLGVRLFKNGFKTAIIDSTTLEEANSKPKNWLRQRSRWIKGYFQTYLVHMRNPIAFARSNGIHALIFQLMIGGRTTFMLINPILWLATIAYFTLYRFVGPQIEALFPTAIFYMAVTSLVFGNFVYLYNYMIGCAKRGHWPVIKYIFLIPFYWVMASIAAIIALVQLFTKPHFWEKTVHGFHLLKTAEQTTNARAKRFQRLADFASSGLASGAVIVGASMVGNVFNFLYNAYLGRSSSITIEEFGLLSLFGSFIFLSQVPLSAISRAITHRTAYLLGKHNTPIVAYWHQSRKTAIKLSLIIGVIWIISIPLLQSFFKESNVLPFILFTPVWIIGTIGSIDNGFLSGNLRFKLAAILGVIEAVIKLILTVTFVKFGFEKWVYAVIPLSMFITFLVGWWQVSRIKQTIEINSAKLINQLDFPFKFFVTSILIKVTTIVFLGLDVILAKHYLSARAAGEYGLLALVGKMIFVFGGIFIGFILPLASHDEGAGKKSSLVFNRLLGITTLSAIAGFIGLGVLGNWIVPLLWGSKSLPILPHLMLYTNAMALFTISYAFVSYHQAKNENIFPLVSFLVSLGEIVGLFFFHTDIYSFSAVISITALISLISMVGLHVFYNQLKSIFRNSLDFLTLFGPLPEPKVAKNKLAILVFNWRDTKHVWAGGAEVYVQELAKRWVKMGHSVTIFSGNDGKNLRHDKIDGVDIIRRGGFFFVYIWAFFYYVVRFVGKYDVIIDCENGIPFFTPLYTKEKRFLLIHHVHQDIFRKSLPYPAYLVANFLEGKLMPLVYRKTEVITVSPSSKADIMDHKLTDKEPSIIYNGVDVELYKPAVKNPTPLVSYVGRLKDYKSLPVFINAAKVLIEKIPNVEFVIAGDGPEKPKLLDLVKKLGLEGKIKFLGRVSEEVKIDLLQKSWVFVNPSLMEGWGITNIEANACGTPVVASNVSGLRDSVHNPHSGFLLPYGNVDEFATHIEKLITNKKLRETMSKESIDWAKKFGWDKSANSCIYLFR